MTGADGHGQAPRSLTFGIVAHVDAGKTSLTERLLYSVGIIDELGSVERGNTQTDSMELERRRGITIKSAVVSFVVDDVMVNLIDTPGHPDFIAEVERVLNVLDGAVLVVSAVEGVQAQTRVLMRALDRLRIPSLIFVNKIDRRGADHVRVLEEIAERLTPTAIAMGSVAAEGTRAAAFTTYEGDDAGFASRLAAALAENDDALLAAYVENEAAVPYDRLRAELATQTRRALVHPVYFGSAITGAGVGPLIAGITAFLPAEPGEVDGSVSGSVFKIERGAAGEKIAYARLFSGTLRVRDRVELHRDGLDADAEAKVTGIEVFRGASADRATSLVAGQIGKIHGLAEIQIGDILGAPRSGHALHRHFAPPTLESVVVPGRAANAGALRMALNQLAEQDPLIDVRQDDVTQEISVSLYGEVQKEVIQATLADTGECIARLGKEAKPFLAGVGLRVEPAPVDRGFEFRLEVELGSMPLAFFKAVEEAVEETLQQGLYGWQVTDCTVTMTHSGYLARQSSAHGVFDKSSSSTAGDFRNLTPLVLMEALQRAGTKVYEPIHRFTVEIPADTLGAVFPLLARFFAVPEAPVVGGSVCTVKGQVPAAHVHDLTRQLGALTRGEGVLEFAFDHYEEVRGANPTRPRWDHNPLDRTEYLLHVVRRV
jgi:ribosomal protection tetracycline resistance protein